MSALLVSRGPVGLVAAVFAGGLSVAFLVTALLHTNTPLFALAYMAGMPLYLAGLGGGTLAGLIAPATGILFLYTSQPPNVAVGYAIFYAVPAMVLSAMSLRYRIGAEQKIYWYPEGKLLAAITVYPCLLFAVMTAAAWNHEGGLLGMTRQAFANLGTDLAKQYPDDEIEFFHKTIDSAAQVAPALLSYAWVFLTVVGLIFAQSILRQNRLNLRDDFSLRTVQAPGWILYIVAAAALAGLFAPEPFGYIGKNLSLILGLPYVFIGLAVTHSFANSMKHPYFFLIPFYAALALAPILALAVAGVGIADHWVDFRQRITRTTTVR